MKTTILITTLLLAAPVQEPRTLRADEAFTPPKPLILRTEDAYKRPAPLGTWPVNQKPKNVGA